MGTQRGETRTRMAALLLAEFDDGMRSFTARYISERVMLALKSPESYETVLSGEQQKRYKEYQRWLGV